MPPWRLLCDAGWRGRIEKLLHHIMGNRDLSTSQQGEQKRAAAHRRKSGPIKNAEAKPMVSTSALIGRSSDR